MHDAGSYELGNDVVWAVPYNSAWFAAHKKLVPDGCFFGSLLFFCELAVGKTALLTCGCSRSLGDMVVCQVVSSTSVIVKRPLSFVSSLHAIAHHFDDLHKASLLAASSAGVFARASVTSGCQVCFSRFHNVYNAYASSRAYGCKC
jgi:hypothetical protein